MPNLCYAKVSRIFSTKLQFGTVQQTYLNINKQLNQKCFLPSRNRSCYLIFIKSIIYFEKEICLVFVDVIFR